MCCSRRHTSARHNCPFRKFDPSSSQREADPSRHQVRCLRLGAAMFKSRRDPALARDTRKNTMLSDTEGNAQPN